ncbi:MAG TPA: hypothetical protein VMN36_11160 [Verrucomicrobiales bacterium]|nr:hypothetical protein [Verrucomicrobiales bacterium]
MKHFLPGRNSLLLASLAALLLLGASYASFIGLGNASRHLIHRYFADHRMEVDIGGLSIDPFRGLVVRDVIVYDSQDRDARLARIKHANIDLSLSSFLEKRLVVDRIELHDTELTFPRIRGSAGNRPLQIRGLDALLHVRGDRLQITRAQGRTGNVRVRLDGELGLPAARGSEGAPGPSQAGKGQPAALAPAPGATWKLLARVADELSQLSFDERPRSALDLQAGGDLGRPDSLHLGFRLRARGFAWRNYRFRGGEMEGRFSRAGLEVTRLLMHDAEGSIRGGFTLPDPGTRLEIHAESTLDFDNFLRTALKSEFLPDTLRFHPSPTLRVSGVLDLDKPYRLEDLPVELSGSIEGQYLEAWGSLFQGYRADFHLAGPRFFFRNARLEHRSGVAEGRFIHSQEDGVRYAVQFRMDPAMLNPFPFPDGVKRFLRKWEFEDQSNVVLELAGEGPQRNPGTWRNTGSVNLSRCRFRGAPLRYFVAHFSFDRDRYVFKDFRTEFLPDPQWGYPGGPIEGDSVVHSPSTGVTDIRQVRGRLHPAQAARCFSTTIAEHLDAYRFSHPPEITMQGVLDTRKGQRTNLVLRFDADDPLQLPLGSEVIEAENLEGEMRIFDDTLTASGLRASLLGGSATGLLVVKDLFNQRTYDAEVSFSDLEMNALARRFLNMETGPGRVSGRFAWSGTGPDPESIDGQGRLSLTGSKLAETPILSGLSDLLARSLGESPLARADVSDAGASFRLGDGSLEFAEAFADVGSFRLSGSGRIDLAGLALDTEWSLANREASGILLSVLYRVLGSYSCAGTLTKPDWRLVKPLPPSPNSGQPFTERLRQEIERSLPGQEP